MMYFFAQGHKPFNLNYYHPNYKKHIIGEIREGDNIDCLNRVFSEYCQMYYVWKNMKFNDDDILTFCHYSRQINPKHVNEKWIKGGMIQAYYLNKYKIKVDKNVKYNLVEGFIKYTRIPYFVYKDLEEYLDSQKILDSNKIMDYMNMENMEYHTRMIFSMRYDKFKELMEFLQGYVDFVANKYNIKKNGDWITHCKNKFIEHFRKVGSKNASFSQMLFQHKNNYNKIYNADYGLNGPCNCWRVYSYIFEYLVSTFIHLNNYFYNTMYQ